MKKSIYILTSFLFIFLTGCSKKDNTATAPTNPGTSGITISSPWQYSVKIAGTTYAHTEGNLNFQGSFSWGASLTTPPDTSSTTFGSGLSDYNSPNLSLSIDVGTVRFMGNTVDTATFKSLIRTGNFSYTTLSTHGARISWVDGAGDFWASDDGTGIQTGSSFIITDVQPVGFVLGHYEMKFKATFNCILYNWLTTQSMILTDGIYVGKFENYN